MPIIESYWVIPGRFRAGAYPGAPNDIEARRKLHWLLNQHTTLFLDLTVEGEPGLRPYVHLLDQGLPGSPGIVVYKRLPIKDFSVPESVMVEQILDTIDLALSLGRNIYLHCYGGKGRTGTVVGCYLVRHGLTGQEALTMIQTLRKELPDQAGQSPETDGQTRMVLNWKRGE